MKRIERKFSDLKQAGQTAFVAYICAGDPNLETSFEILKALPKAGVDIIELGVPFLDPAGDGPIIESASKRAVEGGMNLSKTLKMVADFRKIEDSTPILLMGYYNNFLRYGLNKFFTDAQNSGVDGVLIVDLPLEERDEIYSEISKTNIDLINLVAPLTDEARIKKIADEKYSSGFLYLVSMLGITGTKQANIEDNKINLQKIRENSKLPVVIGFGIQTPDQAKEFSKIDADGVVVGSTIVKEIANNFLAKNSQQEIVKNVIKKIEEFSKAIKN